MRHALCPGENASILVRLLPMTPRARLFALLVLLLPSFAARAADAPEVGPFFEPEQPFFHSQVQLVPPPKDQLVGGNFVIRGILVPLGPKHCAVFDQELMRLAAVWEVPEGQPLVTLMTMAQISNASPKKKANSDHPQPTGRMLLTAGMHPGVASEVDQLFEDPRPPRSFGDEGRGALPATLAHYDGTDATGASAVLHYRSGETAIREWHEAKAVGKETYLYRHFEVAPHRTPLQFALGARGTAPWTISHGRVAFADAPEQGRLRVATNAEAFTLGEARGELIATLAASSEPQRVTLALILGVDAPQAGAPGDETRVGPTPPAPAKLGRLRWPGTATAPAQLASLQQNGLILDRIAPPDENPWRRRVRPADVAFLTDDRAAVVGYDGDVWLVDGFDDPQLAKLTWRRFASGLHEPLAIVFHDGAIQVATKNGVIRVYDRDGNGEADWYENFNDHLVQGQTTRSFPLDMGVGPDGSTYITQGGIVTRSGLPSGGEGTSQTGGFLKISRDGRTSELFAAKAREPFLAVHPRTGVVTATDQQGNYIPSSVCYLVRQGDRFGFMEDNPEKLTPPLVWIPHEQDISSSSEQWIIGEGMGPWNEKLIHLSYGTGRMFIISPDFEAPVPQGAVIPLELKTDLPLLHARMNRKGDGLFVAGFQIWGTRTTTNWAMGRLRRGDTPIVTALAARSVQDGVVLTFAAPLDPASVTPEKVSVRAWNYQRSKAYGSGRYTLAGPAGTTPWGVAQAVLSKDGKSVFIHLPKLPPAHQLEVRHDFTLAGGAAARGVVFFTIHQPARADLIAFGFPKVDFTKAVAVMAREKEEAATPEIGKAVAENLGCAACHSNDGTTEGKVGPTWRRLFGSKRTFIDGSSEIADELYLREKILDPQQKKLKPGQVEMPSYRGVLSEQQLDSVILYIKSLTGRPPAKNDGD